MSATRGRSSSLVATNQCTKQLQRLTKHVARIEKSVKLVGTARDTTSFRTQMTKLIGEAESLSSQVSVGMTGLRSDPHTDRKHLEVLERSSTTVSTQLGTAVSSFKKKARAHMPVEDGVRGGGGSAGYGGQAQTQAQADGVVIEMQGFGEVDQAILQEREAEATKIVTEARAVNGVVQDLAVLVDEQHEQLQEVDANVQASVTKVQKGNEHLEEAVTLQAAARRKQCCILAIVVVVLLVILVPVLVTQLGSSN